MIYGKKNAEKQIQERLNLNPLIRVTSCSNSFTPKVDFTRWTGAEVGASGSTSMDLETSRYAKPNSSKGASIVFSTTAGFSSASVMIFMTFLNEFLE